MDRKYISYALDHDADYMAKDIKIDGPHTSFTVIYKGEVLGDVALNIPGKHKCIKCISYNCSMSSYGIEHRRNSRRI